MRSLLVLIASTFIFTACGNDSGSNAGYPTYGTPNYNYNNYRYRNTDYHRYNGQRYNYRRNDYQNQNAWFNRRGANDIAFCGTAYYDTSGVCYQSCYQRQWTVSNASRSGYVWTCNYATGCGWVVATQNIPWYQYTWVPYLRAASCY